MSEFAVARILRGVRRPACKVAAGLALVGRAHILPRCARRAERDAWNRMVSDVIALSQRLRAGHPGAPVVLLSHSLCSFIAQGLVTRREP